MMMARDVRPEWEKRAPWLQGPLSEWTVVAMHHYFIGVERRLYVAMVKGTHCIVEAGEDDEYLWNRLWHKAMRDAD